MSTLTIKAEGEKAVAEDKALKECTKLDGDAESLKAKLLVES